MRRDRQGAIERMQAAWAAAASSQLWLEAQHMPCNAPPGVAAGVDLLDAAERLAAQVAALEPKLGKAQQQQLAELRQHAAAVRAEAVAAQAPFVWEDGPLVVAMKAGDLVLLDELNLAEDAVLERLNRWVAAELCGWQRLKQSKASSCSGLP